MLRNEEKRRISILNLVRAFTRTQTDSMQDNRKNACEFKEEKKYIFHAIWCIIYSIHFSFVSNVCWFGNFLLLLLWLPLSFQFISLGYVIVSTFRVECTHFAALWLITDSLESAKTIKSTNKKKRERNDYFTYVCRDDEKEKKRKNCYYLLKRMKYRFD